MRHAEAKVPVERLAELARHALRLLLAVCRHAFERLDEADGQQPLKRVGLLGEANDRRVARADADEAAEARGAAKHGARLVHDLAHRVVAAQGAVNERLRCVAQRCGNGDGLEEGRSRGRCARGLPDEAVRAGVFAHAVRADALRMGQVARGHGADKCATAAVLGAAFHRTVAVGR